MSAQFWLGVAVVPVAILIIWVMIMIIQWWHWWFVHNDGRFHGGKGYQHVADFYDKDDGKWYLRGQHNHWWPPDTPFWLISALEPARVWICHHSSEHRPATPRVQA